MLALLFLAGLSAQAAPVPAQIQQRTGHPVNEAARPEDLKSPRLPPGVSLERPLSAEDAVAIALWNSAALHADLAGLGLARADLAEAGLLRNPNLSLLFPVGSKPFELRLGDGRSLLRASERDRSAAPGSEPERDDPVPRRRGRPAGAARWTIRPRLMAIPGVANVAIWGQRDRQLQVLVEPQRLADHKVALDDLLRAAREATLPGAGGFIDTPNQRLAVTHLPVVTGAGSLARVPAAFRQRESMNWGPMSG